MTARIRALSVRQARVRIDLMDLHAAADHGFLVTQTPVAVSRIRERDELAVVANLERPRPFLRPRAGMPVGIGCRPGILVQISCDGCLFHNLVRPVREGLPLRPRDAVRIRLQDEADLAVLVQAVRMARGIRPPVVVDAHRMPGPVIDPVRGARETVIRVQVARVPLGQGAPVAVPVHFAHGDVAADDGLVIAVTVGIRRSRGVLVGVVVGRGVVIDGHPVLPYPERLAPPAVRIPGYRLGLGDLVSAVRQGIIREFGHAVRIRRNRRADGVRGGLASLHIDVR